MIDGTQLLVTLKTDPEPGTVDVVALDRGRVTGSSPIAVPAVPDVLRVSDAVSVFKHLGYPPYLLVFLGTAKMLGVAAVLVPGVPRVKEWAFAGLTFDVTGALYSHLSVGDPASVWMPAAVGLALIAASYTAYLTRKGRSDVSRDRRIDVERATTEPEVQLRA